MNWGGNMRGMISPILTPILAHTLGWTPALDLAALIKDSRSIRYGRISRHRNPPVSYPHSPQGFI